MVDEQEVKIHTDFPDKTEKDIIQQICKAWETKSNHDVENIRVSQLQRFGKSGAKLLLVYFFQEKRGAPHLIKIGPKEDIAKEFSAIKKMYTFYNENIIDIDTIFTSDEKGALLYTHKGDVKPSEAAERPLTFRQILYYPTGDSEKDLLPAGFPRAFNESVLVNSIFTIFYKLSGAHKFELENVKVQEHFDRYFRKDRAQKRLLQILGHNSNTDSFNFIGKEIANPIIVRQQLPEEKILCVGNVHGDLHPDNIVLDCALNSHLIDFAWAEEHKDVLLDFVLLENSIRFWYFPKSANLDEQAAVDELLLEEAGWQEITPDLFSNDEARRLYKRQACMIGEIRKTARQLLESNFTMQRYLFTQFIALYGVICFDEYDPYVTTRALGLIGKRLRDEGWG